MFKNKKLLITGGTGSFGNAVLSKFLETDLSEIRIFSRDEKKQDDMRIRHNNQILKFYIVLFLKFFFPHIIRHSINMFTCIRIRNFYAFFLGFLTIPF